MYSGPYLFKEEEFMAQHRQRVEENGGARATAPPAVILTTRRLALLEMTEAD